MLRQVWVFIHGPVFFLIHKMCLSYLSFMWNVSFPSPAVYSFVFKEKQTERAHRKTC